MFQWVWLKTSKRCNKIDSPHLVSFTQKSAFTVRFQSNAGFRSPKMSHLTICYNLDYHSCLHIFLMKLNCYLAYTSENGKLFMSFNRVTSEKGPLERVLFVCDWPKSPLSYKKTWVSHKLWFLRFWNFAF